MIDKLAQQPVMRYFKFLFALCVIAFMPMHLAAQTKNVPFLERDVTIIAQNKPLEDVLTEISHEAGFVFSYSPEALQSNNKVTINIQKKPVRIVLNELFNDDIDYKTKGKYVILKRPNKSAHTKGETIRMEGYVYDSKTGNKLTEASIYDKNLMVSAVTNEYGYFSVDVPVNNPITALKISKLGYSDTAFITNTEKRLKTVEVSVNTSDSSQVKKWQSFIDLDKIAPKWLIPHKTKINALNINDSIFKTLQVSLVPYFTTNHFLGGNVVNDFSFNATVGYIQGVRILEFGGVINIVRDNASYAQFGGVGNIVGGRFTGVQVGGTFNYASEIKGIQTSGIVNLAGDANVQLTGVINRAINNNLQVSGVGNWARNSELQLTGVINKASTNFLQVAGVINWAKETNLQIAGVLNQGTKVGNMQIAGVVNQAMEVKALQVAGILNNALDNSPIQVAGCVNSALGTTDIQVSGLVNYAGKVNTMQIALLNFADSCNGVPIGLFSFVRKGYHKLEFSVDELFPVNTSFRTGVKRFHTFFSAGINPFRYSTALWTYGYGLGISFGKKDRLWYDLDLSSNHVVYGTNFSDSNNLYRLYIGLDKRIHGKTTLAFGLTYNVMFSDSYAPDYNEVYSKIQPYSLTNATLINGTNVRTWIGARLAVRLF